MLCCCAWFCYVFSSQWIHMTFTNPCLNVKLIINVSNRGFVMLKKLRVCHVLQENVKSLFKSLVRYLSHSNQTIIVSSLSILASLGLNEDIGEKVSHEILTTRFRGLFPGALITEKIHVEILVGWQGFSNVASDWPVGSQVWKFIIDDAKWYYTL